MSTFTIDQLTKYKEIVNNGLSHLYTIINDYNSGLENSRSYFSSITFDGWQDDVQATFLQRKETFDKELSAIEVSVKDGDLQELKRKLELLSETLNELETANNNYNKSKNSLNSERTKGHAGGEANAHIITHYENECTKYKIQVNRLTNEVNQIIQQISQITFGSSLSNNNESVDNTESGANDNIGTVSETLVDKNGTTVVLNTTDTGTEIVMERIITKNGVVIETFTVTIDKSNPKNKTITRNNESYQQTDNGEGRAIETVAIPGQGTVTNSIISETYVLNVTDFDNISTDYDIDINSQTDKMFMYFITETATMRDSMSYDPYGNTYQRLIGGDDHVSVGYATDMTFIPKYQWGLPN